MPTPDGLIVPFPSSRRRSSSLRDFDLGVTSPAITTHAFATTASLNTATTATNPRLMDRHVRFSDDSSLRIYQRSDAEKSINRWYSGAEYKRFQRMQLLEISKARQVISSSPDSIDGNYLLRCLGATNYLSQDTLKRVLLKRELHVEEVLSEQRRQVQLKVRDDEGLGRVSEASSKWSRKRAYDIAILYQNMGSDSIMPVSKNLWIMDC
ncbi:hypothetical protein ACHAXS_012789 [Conticribra weissflogii]